MRRDTGFTLLETVIAMGLIGLLFMNLPGLLAALEKIEIENTLRSGTLACAQEKMEELRFAAMTGRLGSGEWTEVLGSGPYERMERSWSVRASPEVRGLLQVHTGCRTRLKQGVVQKEIRTMMFAQEHGR